MIPTVRAAILLTAVLAASVAFAPAASAQHRAPSLAAAQAHSAKHKKKPHHKTGRPSMTVVGFGMNHLYVANGTTVSNAADCSTMVQGGGYPIGPPQDIYVEVYVKATHIPGTSPTEIGEDIPEDDDTRRIAADQLTLSAPIPFSQFFPRSTLEFGTPPGSQSHIYRGALFSTDDQDGPSASDFDGTYSFEASVEVGGKTLDSTATVTISC
jgi:hypothetical protein